MIMTSLLEQIQSIGNAGLDIMKGKEKGDIQEILDEVVTVNNYEFGKGEDGDYVVFTIKENDTEFFFGSSVVTENFFELNNILMTNEVKDDMLAQGITMSLHQKKSKNNRKYIYNVFFPKN